MPATQVTMTSGKRSVRIDGSALQKEAEKALEKEKAKRKKRKEIQTFLSGISGIGKDEKISKLEKKFLDLHRELAAMSIRKKEINEDLKLVEAAMEASGLLGQMEFCWGEE